MATTREQYQFERGRYEQFQDTVRSRMACAPTPAAAQRIWEEGDQIRARMEQLADQVRSERNAFTLRQPDDGRRRPAAPVVAAAGVAGVEQRYTVAICAIRCVVCPGAVFTLTPRADEQHAAELERIERKWRYGDERERSEAALDAELLAHRLAPRNASLVDVKMPGAILDEMNTTDAIIEQLGRDIEASKLPSEKFKAAWRDFRAEWKKFFTEHQGWTDRLWYGAYEKTVEYRTRALDWRRQFEMMGGKPTAPPDKPPTPAGFGVGDIPWGKVALGAAAVLALGAGVRYALGR
jgi:hypothetical protein